MSSRLSILRAYQTYREFRECESMLVLVAHEATASCDSKVY
jgi:hypothetical protein